jgi:molybdopterin/thiamine biosynthesis adenylyltransferase
VSAAESRLEQAGADVLRICETTVLVAADAAASDAPWLHPAWPLCRGLGAAGFGCVHLRGLAEYRDDFLGLMEGFPFTQEPAGCPPGEAPPCDIVLHLGDDPDARDAWARLAAARSSAFVSLSWGVTWVLMQSPPGVAGPGSSGGRRPATRRDPLPPISRIAAGLALQEALIVAGRLETAAPPDPRVSFDAAAESRTVRAEGAGWPDLCLEPPVVEVIGAGGVGTHLLESLAPLLGPGCELRIYDFDAVGPENLAVQACFSPADVGRPKALVMAEALALTCDPGVDLRPMVMRYEERPSDLSPPSLRVACPDSFAARKYVNDLSVGDCVPLVEAGSSPLAAQQRTYLPHRTACLEHRITDLEGRATSERDRARCAEQEAFTLPGTNMICGGLLAAEALRALHPEELGWPSPGTIVYDARFPERFGVIEPRSACSHPPGGSA